MKPLELSEFSRMPHAKFLWNATRMVKEGVRVSITFNDPGHGLWQCGEFGSFEVAIQINSGHNHGWSLVTVDGKNSRTGCDNAEIERLMRIAETLIMGPRIEVFDRFQGDKSPRWGHRFDTALGEDFDDKMTWVKRLWKEGSTFRLVH